MLRRKHPTISVLANLLRLAESRSVRESQRGSVPEPTSLLKKPPGEGTGPTMHADFRRNLVGRVPSRGEWDVFQQTARVARHELPWVIVRQTSPTATRLRPIHSRPRA